MKGLQPSGIRRRNKMIYAAVVLFLENGYEKTTTAQIARRAGMSATSFFAPYLPGAQASDFYELEIASAGVMRGFMGRPCDLYFTIERKLRRFLSCCMRLYCVPEEKQEQVIARVLQMDLRTQAQEIVGEAVRRAEAGFEAVMADTGQA